jgi:DNA-directed RNA polymerase specialized sigma24 family protein
MSTERREFLTTRWSLVEAAGGSDGERARAALAELCGDYWYPLYAYVRRCGVDADGAQDVVQGFFADLIERGDLGRLSRGAGRFRGFLKVAVRNHLANLRDRERAAKRGGGRVRLSVDLDGAAERYAREPAGDDETPERAFDRLWALELLERCVAELGAEYAASGRELVFEELKGALQGADEGLDYPAAAARLGTSEGAVRVAVHRLRKRFGERLRARIAETVARADEVEGELDDLFQALGG